MSHVTSDGVTVWVNSEQGDCIGRFGVRGIDIHRTAQEQLDGKGECLFCTHEKTTIVDWHHFVQKMTEHYGTVPEQFEGHRPKRFA